MLDKYELALHKHIDNAGWHRSQKVVVPEGIEIEFLPPYSRPVTTSRKTMAVSG